VNRILKALLLVLLGESAFGFTKQAPAPELESLLAGAQHAQAAGDYATAAEDYRKAVEINPNTPELWANLGLMQQETGDLSAATKSFLQANHLNSSLYVSNLFLGIDYAHSGEAIKAIPYLIKAENTNKSDPQAPLALGRAYLSEGKFAAAAQQLDRAITLAPKLDPAWFTLGIARLDQVEVDARSMSKQYKESPFAEALYAESLSKQSRFGEAASVFKSLLNSLPQPPCIRSELGFALLREHDQSGAAAAFSSERALHPECGLALLGQASLAIDSGDADRADSLLNELWNRDHGFFASNTPILLDGLSSEKASAAINLLTNQVSSAVSTDLRNALLAAFNQSDQVSFDLSASQQATAQAAAGAAFRSGRTAEGEYASGHFEQCVLRLEAGPAPLSVDHLRLLAACSFFAGDSERASSAATALRALEPHSLEALYWSIRANERLAFQSLARFQQLDPNSARSHVLLADIFQQLERFDDAQAECLKALAIAPGDPAAMFGLASAYLSNSNPKDAMEIAQKALTRTPDDPELNLIMAEALMSQREYAASQPYLIKSLHAKPQLLPRIHALLGKSYAETGRTQEAIGQLKLGASSDEDGSVQYLLARLYRQIGDVKDATEAINRVKIIKQQRQARGVKRIEDPDLSALESVAAGASSP
jgi:tetratricopeptide (TPR) repeat protein